MVIKNTVSISASTSLSLLAVQCPLGQFCPAKRGSISAEHFRRKRGDKSMSSKKKSKDEAEFRTRNFATVVYEDSAPENWQEILSSHLVPAFISPYHDRDVNPTGEPKKPHWHVMIMFDGKKSLEQVKAVFKTINGVGCEVVQSIRGYARYLCHLDNPEKAQYLPDDVRQLCGADYNNIIGLVTDKYKAIREMISWCDEYRIVYYSDLLRYASFERADWFRVLCDCGSYVMKEHLKSCADKEKLNLINKEKPDTIPKILHTIGKMTQCEIDFPEPEEVL